MTTISFDRLSCDISPERGGVLLSFCDRHGDVLRAGSLEAATADPRHAACFPCAPWFGRIFGDLKFAQSQHSLTPTLPACDPDYALHGDGWVSAWEGARHTDEMLAMRLVGKGDLASGFPFPYEAAQTFALARSGLTIALALKNASPTAMPAGLGLHPYFPRTETTRVTFAAAKMWTPPADGAAGRLGALPGRLGSGAAAKLPEATLDHSFVDFGGKAVIADGARTITLVSDAPVLHLYAPAGRDYFCLEPVSHLPGELTRAASGFGGRVLAPGQEMSLRLTIARS